MNKFKSLSKKEKAEYIAIVALYPLFMLFSFLDKSLKLFGTKRRQITASVLSLAMVLTMLPAMSFTAFAAGWTGVSDGGIGFNYGDNGFINITMPTTNGYYTYGTCTTAAGTTTAAETATNSAALPSSGWNWAVKKESSTISGRTYDYTVTFNNFNLYYSDSNDAFMLKTPVKIDLTGANIISAPNAGTALSSYYKDIYIDGNGSLDVTGRAAVISSTTDNKYVTVAGGTVFATSTQGYFITTPFICTGGTVTAKSNMGAFKSKPDFSGYTDAEITASTDVNGENPVTYNENAWNTYKYVKIEGKSAHPTSWAELQTAIDAGGKIKLTQDIVAGSGDAQLNVPSTSTVTIDLNGYKIDRALTTATSYGGVFYIDGGNLTINDTSTAKRGQITGGNAKGDGGGVYSHNNGTFTMNGGSITDNAANYGGGVFISDGTFIMTGGNITDNTASQFGGGVYSHNNGTFTMNGGSITGNTASSGGGVSIYKGAFTMSGGSITGNTASQFGGGVYNSNIFSVSGSATIKDNTLTDGTTKSNAYLASDYYITVSGTLTGEIGVSTQSTSYPVTVTKVSTNPAYSITASDVAKLTSDVDGYEAVLSGDVAVLQKILGTLTNDNFTYNAPTDTTYSGTTKVATVTANSGVSCGTITIKYYDASGTPVTSPTNVGAYTVKIDVAANDNYKAATDLDVGTFTITAKALTKSDLTVTNIENSYIIDGTPIKPVPTVKYGDVTLVKDTDYTLSYGTNTAIGKGSVTINFKGNYSGSAQYEFDIAYGTATTAMYTVSEPNSNNWYNSSISVSAANGYTISPTATDFPNGIRLTVETADGAQDIYLKAADGKIYKGTFTYKLDKTAPTDVKIQYNNSGFKSFLNTITFGLFFKETVNVEATASDTLSGVDTIQYYAADSEIADATTITGWQNSLSLTQKSKKIVYIKVTDKAGNVVITNNEGVVVYTDSTLLSTSADFDRNNQADITIPFNFNGNSVAHVSYKLALKGGSLKNNTEYTITSSSIIIKNAAIAELLEKSGMDIIIYLNPMGVEFAGIENSPAMLTFRINDVTHYHSGTHHAREEATCTADGNVEYWSCSCGKYFSDEGCTTPITNIILTKLGHDYTEKKIDAAHLKSAATCTSPAVYYYDCSRCDEISTTETFTDGEALGHSFGTEWQKNADNHWHSCIHDGCTEISDKAAHDWDDGEITKPATTEDKGEKTFTCTICDATKTEPIDMLPPTITGGANGKFTQGGKNGLTFESDAALADLESVSVDSKVLDKKDYDTQIGSTVIILKPAFLETLSVGKHRLDIKSASGTASTEFTIEAKAAEPTKPGDATPPQTGDSNSMMLWVCLLFVSGGALTTLGISKKHKKANSK